MLEDNGYAGPDDPVVIQSFETSNLQRLSRRTDLPLVQLVDCAGAPYELAVATGSQPGRDLRGPVRQNDVGTRPADTR